jgi:hypothetical protein
MAQTETGAAGTVHFEPGGVAFLGKSNRNEPAEGLLCLVLVSVIAP